MVAKMIPWLTSALLATTTVARSAVRAPHGLGVAPRGRTCMSSATESSKVAGLVHMLEASKAAPRGFVDVVKGLQGQYAACAELADLEPKAADEYLATYIKLAIDQVQKPYAFPPFHESVRAPFDFYEFGKRFFAPMVDLSRSAVLGEDMIKQVVNQLAAGDNVVLFANHQIEPDPTVLSLLLDADYPTLVPNMISVAGDRVTTDPMAAPMSMGRNLLCIFSKRHIENPPEQTEQKKQHNQRAMRVLGELLAEGGKCVWIAPSGGRDRPTADSGGKVVPAPFDPKNIDMFRLLGAQAAKASGRVTHYYPLAMYTYPITPPPNEIGGQVGEARILRRKGVGIALGAEVDMRQVDGLPKDERRTRLAASIYDAMAANYAKLLDRLE
uniref:Phospholipid/glycerol acyltransferase domain-containing protein n=2 Tax=Diacronema lutheri TaxID=2081491 RepID=A0A7R9UZB7_DIALT|mmetsp:Transcript_9678/g.30649  ORF Transcript_9678/g.30649 Transcript_9678/m.30649 type:complete len:384 (+) Transcript_9678:29-1180(+)